MTDPPSYRLDRMASFDPDRIARLDGAMAERAADDGLTGVGGVAWWASCGRDVVAGAAGVLTRGEPAPAAVDSQFRIASITKPIVAVAAMVLVEQGRLRLHEPIDDLAPELADRQVLVDPLGPVDGPTVPADRPITLLDVLTSRMGLGMDFVGPWPATVIDHLDGLGLGPTMPAPGGPPDPDEWMRRLGTVPLQAQPGTRWLYNLPSDVLGVLVARATGQPLDVALRELVLDPLGMDDTGFVAADVSRLGTSYGYGDGGRPEPYDPPGGQWSTPPAFPSGAGGLVSTVADIAALGSMLLAGGWLPDGSRLLSAASVQAMTSDQVGVAAGRAATDPDGTVGWGLGMGVQVRRHGLRTPGSYGWDGGLGSSWWNDPATGLVGVVCATDMFRGPAGPPTAIEDFWTIVRTSVVDG